MIKKLKILVSMMLTLSILIIPLSSSFAKNPNKILVQEQADLIPQEFFDSSHPDAIKDPKIIEKFEKMLNESKKQDLLYNESENVQATAGVASIIAVYNIPGLGQVALLATGAVLFGGVIYYTGSWVYEQVQSYLSSSAAKNEYNDAKEKGHPTENHDIENDRSLPTTSAPYSSKDLNDSKGIKQRRYYDKEGNADMDIDYRHGDDGTHKFPHRHDWINGSRGPAY